MSGHSPLSQRQLEDLLLQTDAVESLLTSIDNRLSGGLTATVSGILTVSTVTNLVQMNGVAIEMGTGVRTAGTQRVTIATNDLVPISAASLPLPSGASTAAKQPALGTAGVSSADVISVQGIASGTAVIVNPGNTANTTAWLITKVTSNRSDTYTATGNGTTIDVSTRPVQSFAISVKATGAVTSWDVRLEGSLNNVEFTTILTHTNVTPGDGVVLSSGSSLSPSLYIRSRAAGLVLGAGTNVVVTILGIQ